MKCSQEHEEIRRAIKRFIDAEINPHVDEWEAAEQFPAHEVFKKLGNMGMLGLTKPEAYGGAAIDYSNSVVFAETLGQIRCGGVPMAIGVHGSSTAGGAYISGKPDQKNEATSAGNGTQIRFEGRS